MHFGGLKFSRQENFPGMERKMEIQGEYMKILIWQK